ncbi:GL14602 [Drosophila persimilis]|uniref:GL14602 n=1 Tax=Drosophila persimilis TaxID=7234 RepID=B4GVU2_DROPE|nr:GL14602 [Drosophila persimilis]
MQRRRQQPQPQQQRHKQPPHRSRRRHSSVGKSNIHELRNQDYVSRLMAATPPYLYSGAGGAK